MKNHGLYSSAFGIIDAASRQIACPLQKVDVHAVLNDTLAEVFLQQTYQNLGEFPIEGIYTFPVEYRAMITGLTVRVGQNTIEGYIEEKEEAFRIYDETVRQGDSAFLLEQHRDDVLQISLGRIEARETVDVSIRYLQEVKEIDNEIRWLLPTVLAPRYMPGSITGDIIGPGTGYPTDQVPDADFITPPIRDEAYVLSLKAELKGVGKIRSVQSPSHPVSVQIADGNQSAVIALSREDEPLNRDFILVIKTHKESGSRLITAVTPEEISIGSLRLFLQMPMETFKDPEYRKEYMFLLDASGSMSGRKFNEARRAVQIALRNLSAGDQFNICAFGSDHVFFASEVVDYVQENIDLADRWLTDLPMMGGTEILKPVREVLDRRSKKEEVERELVMFLMTDGQVGNEAEILRYVRSHNHGVHLMTFGIDTAVNQYFIEELALAGNGMSELVFPGERIEEKVIRQFSRIHMPRLMDPVLKNPKGSELTVLPTLPKSLVFGEVYRFMIRNEAAKRIEATVLEGEIDGETYCYNIETEELADGKLLTHSWAMETIRTLEETMNREVNPRLRNLTKDRIVELSRKTGILSKWTSLVAKHIRKEKGREIPHTIVVPVDRPDRWNVVKDNQRLYSIGLSSLNISDSADMDIQATFDFEESESMQMTSNHGWRKGSMLTDAILDVARMQNADGSFGGEGGDPEQTACFIIGMLLAGIESRQYKVQISKSLSYLADFGNPHSVLIQIAFFLASHENLETFGFRNPNGKPLYRNLPNDTLSWLARYLSIKRGDYIHQEKLLDVMKSPFMHHAATELLKHVVRWNQMEFPQIPDNAFLDLLEKDYCTQMYCTTCGCMDFRRTAKDLGDELFISMMALPEETLKSCNNYIESVNIAIRCIPDVAKRVQLLKHWPTVFKELEFSSYNGFRFPVTSGVFKEFLTKDTE